MSPDARYDVLSRVKELRKKVGEEMKDSGSLGGRSIFAYMLTLIDEKFPELKGEF